jgi:hypothetical protein
MTRCGFELVMSAALSYDVCVYAGEPYQSLNRALMEP